MTFNELADKVFTLLPDAVIERDNEGQLVIYTGLTENEKGHIVSFEVPEEVTPLNSRP